MPKVTKVTFVKDALDIVSDLCVNSSGTFSIKLPREIYVVTGISEVSGKTKDAVVNSWKDVLNDYVNSVKTERKVIFFKANISAKIDVEHDERGGSSWSHKRIVSKDDIFRACGIAMEIEAGVFVEKKTIFSGTERYEYNSVKENMIPRSVYFNRNLTSLRGGAQQHGILVLDWTDERERTVARFCANLEDLVINIVAFTEKPEIFQALVDGKQGLFLPGPTNDREIGA